MKVINLISNVINYRKNRNMSASIVSSNTLEVAFYLSIPAFVNDKNLLNNSTTSEIIYRGSRKRGIRSYHVDKSNIDLPYPLVTKNKVYCVFRKYDIRQWIDFEYPGIFTFLSSERENIFREVKSNILLEKIGILSKQWEELSSGKNSYELTQEPPPYSHSVPTKYEKAEPVEELPF